MKITIEINSEYSRNSPNVTIEGASCEADAILINQLLKIVIPEGTKLEGKSNNDWVEIDE